MMDLFDKTCIGCSRLITINYSTSFSMGIRMFDKKFRDPIYSIYGFVRLADEIVDTFHSFPKEELLQRFREDTFRAIQEKISLNPVLHAFQFVVRKYKVENQLIDAFLHSMSMDLHHTDYENQLYKEYIYGSAEVVGLMCLKVFCEGNEGAYNRLKPYARSLGAAFQKVNFLRDMKSDYDERGRVYFPGVDFSNFDNDQKKQIEMDIQRDFDEAYKGVVQLPTGARLGVYLAYVYYLNLFKKIIRTKASKVKEKRIRVSDKRKLYLLLVSACRNSLNIL